MSLLDVSKHVELTEEEWRWLEEQKFWYCPVFPLRRIPASKRGHRRASVWKTRLEESIDRYGLRSPVVLNNSNPSDSLNHSWERAFSVRAGNHRIWACRRLGWAHIPALVWGRRPYLHARGLPMTLEEVNDSHLLGEGHLELRWYGPTLKGANDPIEEFGG